MKTDDVKIFAPIRVNEAVCKEKCGAPVAWFFSKRKGSWYLADAIIDSTSGKVIPMGHKPHFLTCTGAPKK
jgi:hypothetical protein